MNEDLFTLLTNAAAALDRAQARSAPYAEVSPLADLLRALCDVELTPEAEDAVRKIAEVWVP